MPKGCIRAVAPNLERIDCATEGLLIEEPSLDNHLARAFKDAIQVLDIAAEVRRPGTTSEKDPRSLLTEVLAASPSVFR